MTIVTMVVVVAGVVVKVMVWAGAVISILVEVLVIDRRTDVVIILEFFVPVPCVEVLSDVVAGTVVGVLFEVTIRVVADIVVDVLANMNANVLAAMMTALDLSAPTPTDLFSCSAALDSSPLAVFNCVRVLQASKPSYHLCPTLVLSALPQFPNQEPPRPQQLLLPDLPMMPHLGHTETMAVLMVPGVHVFEH